VQQTDEIFVDVRAKSAVVQIGNGGSRKLRKLKEWQQAH
jgi:hypothetical protein